MRRLLVTALIASFSALGQVSVIQGTWTGTLNAGFTHLRVVLHIGEDGVAKMDSLDQGQMNIPVEDVQVNGTHVTANVPSLKGSFEGDLLENASKLQGKWHQRVTLPITFVR